MEEEVELIAALATKTDDLGVLIDWAGQGEDVTAELSAGLEQLAGLVEGGEIKKMLGGEHDRKNAIITIHPGAGGTRVAGLGRDVAADVYAMDRATGVQARSHRLSAG